MKKFMILLVAMTVLFSTAALADSLSGMTDGELLELHQDVLDEMARRGLPAEPVTDAELAGITESVTRFFTYWSVNDLENMLELCDSDWKASAEEPLAELFSILGNRTPFDMYIETVYEDMEERRNPPECYRVTANSLQDRNDGTRPVRYRFRFRVRKEEDGSWHVNPADLENREIVEEDVPAETENPDSPGIPNT